MKKLIVSLAVAFTPIIAFAQDVLEPVTNADTLITKIADLADSLVWLFISVAVLWIVWNVVQFIRQTDGEKRTEYRTAIMWGIVGLFVILSIWGLVNILGNTFNIGNADNQGNAANDINYLLFKRTPKTSTTGGAGTFNPTQTYTPGSGAANPPQLNPPANLPPGTCINGTTGQPEPCNTPGGASSPPVTTPTDADDPVFPD